MLGFKINQKFYVSHTSRNFDLKRVQNVISKVNFYESQNIGKKSVASLWTNRNIYWM